MKTKKLTPATLIRNCLALNGVMPTTVERFGDEYQVRVTSVADVFRAESVARKLLAIYGIEVIVAF
jgi:hypothetical protein